MNFFSILFGIAFLLTACETFSEKEIAMSILAIAIALLSTNLMIDGQDKTIVLNQINQTIPRPVNVPPVIVPPVVVPPVNIPPAPQPGSGPHP
jgi:hypothetical protein